MKRMRIKQAASLLLITTILFSQPIIADATRSITEIKNDQKELQSEIDALDAELYGLVREITELEGMIEETEAEIEETALALEDAKLACEQQYAAMKIRIQYMYENEDPSVFEMLLESGSISDFLNRVDYVNSVYQYDREKMDQFKATQAEIEELGIALEAEKEELESAKGELDVQKSALNEMISDKKSTMKDLDAELKVAREIAAREAALRAAAARAQGAKTTASSSYNVNGNLNPGKTTGISGSEVISFANQFVGCPYVWGGTSLTNGCDCSGFVMGVLANYGISWGTRMTSATFRNVGNEVSYNYMQPGDIVCYPGHVALYQGNGLIVEAQSTATGITNYRSVNCHSIITIRRVL